MQIKSAELRILCGDPEHADEAGPMPIFSSLVCTFLNELSFLLLHDAEAKKYPAVITYAFFCRKANIVKIKERYAEDAEKRIGRGLVFHIAPGNVPVNFAYSLTAGLLAGNACIVKASSKDFRETCIISEKMNSLLGKADYNILAPYVSVVMYPKEEQTLTERLSEACSVRVIWGGDNTIKMIRRSPLRARAFEITFADRYSVCVINAAELIRYSSASGLKQLAEDFYNDTYLYDCNACSTPSLIYWIGSEDDVNVAQNRFWSSVYENIEGRYEVAPVIAVDKYTMACKAAIDLNGEIVFADDNRIVRIKLERLSDNISDYRSAGGLFIEYADQNMDALMTVVNEKYQTLSYFGMNPDEIRTYLISRRVKGIDRIVSIGKTADFGFIWDGYDLIQTMSRIVNI